MNDPALPTSVPAAVDGQPFGLPGLVGTARRCLPEEPGVAVDMLRDVERAVTHLARAAVLLRSVVDDYDGGMLPPAEAMTAVRDIVRGLPWADR